MRFISGFSQPPDQGAMAKKIRNLFLFINVQCDPTNERRFYQKEVWQQTALVRNENSSSLLPLSFKKSCQLPGSLVEVAMYLALFMVWYVSAKKIFFWKKMQGYRTLDQGKLGHFQSIWPPFEELFSKKFLGQFFAEST